MPRLVRVAAVGEVPAGRGKLVTADGVELALFHSGDGRYYASDALCPHEEGPLSEGALEGPTDRPIVICPWHAFDFDLTTGRCLVDPMLNVRVYPVHVTGDGVLIGLP